MKWPSESFLLDSALFLAVVLTAVVGYKLSPLVAPRAEQTIAAPADCDLHRFSCRTRLPDGGEVEFSILPRPIEPMQPLRLAVRVSGHSVRRVKVDFAGVEMNMGFLRPTLREEGEGLFVGEVSLPVCVTGRMLWQATVLLDGREGRVAITHRFAAGH